MLMGFVDLLFVGKLGAVALGGLGLGNSIFTWILTIGVGLLFGLDYPIAHAFGAGDRSLAFRTFIQGLYLSVVASVPAILLVVGIAFLLPRFGLNPEALPYAKSYLIMTAISLLPIFLFNAAKSYLQAQAIAVPAFMVLVLANLLNIFLCAAFIEGRFGFPNHGFEGLAYSTVISRFFMAAGLLGYLFWSERKKTLLMTFGFDSGIYRRILHLGIPASAHMLLEVGVFSFSTALAAKFSAENLAAHQIVLNTASMLFMIPLGIGSAAASLVGQAYGANRLLEARRTGNLSLRLGFGFALISSTLLILFGDFTMRLYTTDTAVVEAAKKLLFVAALFQISDGMQVIAAGALRGLGNTVWAAISNGIGHWLIGLPLGLALGFRFALGVQGIWIGLATGLTVVAAALVRIWLREIRKAIQHSRHSAVDANVLGPPHA